MSNKKNDSKKTRSKTSLPEYQTTVSIKILEAKGLPPADMNGLSDPFCYIYYNEGNKRVTPVIKKTLSPVWTTGNKFTFGVEDTKMDMIHIIVWDKDPIGKDFLGQCYIPASVCTSHPDTKVDLWVKLCDEKVKKKKEKDKDTKEEDINRGELRVMLCYNVSKIFKNTKNTKQPNDNLLKQSAAVVFKENAMANYDNKRFDIPSSEIKIIKSMAEGTNALIYFGKYRGQDVAIKELKQAVDPVQMKDFQTEFNLLCELKSPHIVLFYGASITEDYKIRMVFQYCPNGSLYDAIKNNNFKLSWSKFFRASIQIAEAANFLHSWTPQILHRDIKSLNFLVDEYWNCKIADLGLSRKNEDNAETLKKMRGTYQYTPPESYQKEQPYTAKSDIYSLAIVFWELAQKCCTGVYMAPFKEYGLSYGFQILIKVAKEGLRPTVHPSCPAVIADFIKLSWSTDPTLRPTAKEIIHKFEEIHKTYRDEKTEWDLVCAAKNEKIQPPVEVQTNNNRNSSNNNTDNEDSN